MIKYGCPESPNDLRIANRVRGTRVWHFALGALTISERLFWVVLVPLFAACFVTCTSRTLVQQTGNRAWMSMLYVSTVPAITISALLLFFMGLPRH